jgi:TonB family protein
VSGKWRDYYRILGVRPDATQDEIKEAWIFFVKAFHPDKFARSSQRQQTVAQERTKAVNEAYDILSDATRRAAYDHEYARNNRAEASPPQSPRSPPPTASRNTESGRPKDQASGPSPPPRDSTSRAYTSANDNGAQATRAAKTNPPAEQSRTEPLSPVLHGAGLYIAWLIAAAMLVSAAVEKHPYSFYMLLRWICCPIFAYSAFAAHEKNRVPWVWVFGALAALYNPIFLVHLNRSTWIGVNWFTVGTIIVAAVAFLPRRAQIWIAAATGVVIVIVGLWQLQPVTRPQASVSNASPHVSESAPTQMAGPKYRADIFDTIGEKEYYPPNPGETTWQWLQRNDMHGLPGNYNLELEPNEPLSTPRPFAKPKPGDLLYDVEKELDLGKQRSDGSLVRLYRRGVFAGYNVIKKITAANLLGPPPSPNKYVSSDRDSELTPIQRAIPRAVPVAPTATTSLPTPDSQSANVFDQFDAAPTAITPVPASTATESAPSDSTAGKPKIVYAPHPSYPPKADKTHVTGSGRFKITFDERGNTKSVEIVQSTGDRTLDSNTIKTLKLWRAAPGSPSYVIVPIDYRQNRRYRPNPQANTSQRYQSRGPQPQPPPPNVQAPQINPYTPR